MKKIVILLFLISFSACRKCITCTDTLTITSAKKANGYPKTFQATEDFCGRERKQLISGTESTISIEPSGDTLTYYTERTCNVTK